MNKNLLGELTENEIQEYKAIKAHHNSITTQMKKLMTRRDAFRANVLIRLGKEEVGSMEIDENKVYESSTKDSFNSLLDSLGGKNDDI